VEQLQLPSAVRAQVKFSAVKSAEALLPNVATTVTEPSALIVT
jgi:hypothetical protein